MVVIPAIDLKNGSCVRLRQGRMQDATQFSDDPVAMVGRWHTAGARRLHIVDLNGAVDAKPRHSEEITRIIEAYPDMDVQVGGGIRDEDTISTYLEAGAKWVILGTVAIKDPSFAQLMCERYPHKVIIGIDARNGQVASEGWVKGSDTMSLILAQQFYELPVAAFIYTDIARDGMMSGINMQTTLEMSKVMVKLTGIPVIASGGVSNMEDIIKLKSTQSIDGVIVGRALYEGTIDLRQALKISEA